MAATVTDASALAAVAFDEPASDDVVSQLDSAERLVAPALLWFELANICWKKIRRHPDDADRLLQCFEWAVEQPVQVLPVDHRAVIDLARETRLSAYDASYLWLSRHLGGELVTLDAELRAAAAQE